MAKIPPRVPYPRASKTDDTLKRLLETLMKRVEELDGQMATRLSEMGDKINSMEEWRTAQVPKSVQKEQAVAERVQSEAEAGTASQKEVLRSDSRVKVEVSCFRGSLKPEELLDWVEELERFFDWDEVADPRRVKFACTKLRGHAVLWWERLQKDRVAKKLDRIQRWDEMVARLKAKFLPTDYHQRIFRDCQNLRQKERTVSEYTDEFFKLTIRSERVEAKEETVARYINGLSYAIQDELVVQHVTSVDEAYQLALRVEEKLNRRSKKRPYERYSRASRWRQPRGVNRWSSEENTVRYRSTRGNQSSWRRTDSSFPQLRRTGETRQPTDRALICYVYGEEGHLSYDCQHKKKLTDRKEDRRAQLARVESELNSPTRSKEKTVRKKALLSSADKWKTDRSSADR